MSGFGPNVTFAIWPCDVREIRKSDGVLRIHGNPDNVGMICVTPRSARFNPSRLAWSITASTLARVTVTLGDPAP
jgi:hypothetical protein